VDGEASDSAERDALDGYDLEIGVLTLRAGVEEWLERVDRGECIGAFVVRRRRGSVSRRATGGAALSGGQRRRPSVAQGVLRHPDVLLLDEPTEGLDAPTPVRLLAGVRDADPNSVLVIALHDRQSLILPWTPTARVELPG
jgi:ABC-type transport system involved in cytochrome bd biosynthesis fused ATPase/permease subunit